MQKILASAGQPDRWNLCTRRKNANVTYSLSHFKIFFYLFWIKNLQNHLKIRINKKYKYMYSGKFRKNSGNETGKIYHFQGNFPIPISRCHSSLNLPRLFLRHKLAPCTVLPDLNFITSILVRLRIIGKIKFFEM